MGFQAWLMLGLLVALFALLFRSKIPAWVLFLGTLTLAMTLGLAPEDAALAGFSNPGVLTVAVLLPVAAGMYRTGAITLIAERLIGLPETVGQALQRILIPTAVGSAFLNNTPLVAMMIPVVRDISRTRQLPSSKLYMPLSFASIIGGAATLIGTSSNLIIAGMVTQEIARGGVPGLREVTVFTPSGVGVPAAIAGVAFLMLVGTRLLPDKAQDDALATVRVYGAEFVAEPDSPLIGKTVDEAGLRKGTGYELVGKRPAAEERKEMAEERPAGLLGLVRRVLGRRTPQPAPVHRSIDGDIIAPGDQLTFTANVDALPDLWTLIGLKSPHGPPGLSGQRHQHRLAEVVVSEQHYAIGRQLKELPLTDEPKYRARIIGISRGGQPVEDSFPEVTIRAGDTAVLEVEESFFYEARSEDDFSLVRRLHGYRIQRTDRATAAAIITAAMIGLAAFGVMSMLNAALLAVLAMFATGCLSFRTAIRSVDLETIIVLASAVGLEAAVTGSGLSEAIAEVLSVLGGDSPHVALAVVFAGAVLMTNLITNAAAAAFLFPVSISMATALEVSPMPFVIALMMATSYALVNPAGYQTNLMVMRPGGYEFGDYAKVGVPLTVLLGIIVVLLAPLFFPF